MNANMDYFDAAQDLLIQMRDQMNGSQPRWPEIMVLPVQYGNRDRGGYNLFDEASQAGFQRVYGRRPDPRFSTPALNVASIDADWKAVFEVLTAIRNGQSVPLTPYVPSAAAIAAATSSSGSGGGTGGSGGGVVGGSSVVDQSQMLPLIGAGVLALAALFLSFKR